MKAKLCLCYADTPDATKFLTDLYAKDHSLIKWSLVNLMDIYTTNKYASMEEFREVIATTIPFKNRRKNGCPYCCGYCRIACSQRCVPDALTRLQCWYLQSEGRQSYIDMFHKTLQNKDNLIPENLNSFVGLLFSKKYNKENPRDENFLPEYVCDPYNSYTGLCPFCTSREGYKSYPKLRPC